MRTRERLVAVCQSLNPYVVGGYTAHYMKMAACEIDRIGAVNIYRDVVLASGMNHPSPHVRELAEELLELK